MKKVFDNTLTTNHRKVFLNLLALLYKVVARPPLLHFDTSDALLRKQCFSGSKRKLPRREICEFTITVPVPDVRCSCTTTSSSFDWDFDWVLHYALIRLVFELYQSIKVKFQRTLACSLRAERNWYPHFWFNWTLIIATAIFLQPQSDHSRDDLVKRGGILAVAVLGALRLFGTGFSMGSGDCHLYVFFFALIKLHKFIKLLLDFPKMFPLFVIMLVLSSGKKDRLYIENKKNTIIAWNSDPADWNPDCQTENHLGHSGNFLSIFPYHAYLLPTFVLLTTK